MSTTLTLELEQKRQAVLASLKKNRSQTQSPQVSPPQRESEPKILLPAPQVAMGTTKSSVSTKSTTQLEMDTLLEAILDLRRLGYSFGQIVKEAGVSRQFLLTCFQYCDFPVVLPSSSTTSLGNQTKILRNNTLDSRQTTPTVNSRPRFNNKPARETERPDWLNNLVISLETSDEEDDDEHSIGNEAKEDGCNSDIVDIGSHTATAPQEVTKRPISPIVQEGQTKRRRLSIDKDRSLDAISSKKKQVKLRIELLSKKIKDSNTNGHDNLIRTKVKEIDTIELQITEMERSMQKLKDRLLSAKELKARLIKETEDCKSLKDSLANGLIELESIEIEEAKLKQLKRNKSFNKQAEKANDDTTNVPNAVKDPSLVSDETIHKIPKAKEQAFTPYQSYGYSKKKDSTMLPPITVSNSNISEQSGQLCPLELVNGSCLDKDCRFQHLG